MSWEHGTPETHTLNGKTYYAYMVPSGELVDRRFRDIGLSYTKNAEGAIKVCAHSLGTWHDIYESNWVSAPLWAVLAAPLEAEANEWGEVCP